MRQFKPLPSHLTLAPTLAQRVQQLREYRNLTVKDLAKASRLGLRRIEDIEGGLETWLSSTNRQMLAKALAVEPYVIQEAESRPPAEEGVLMDEQNRIAAAILRGSRDLECPNCGTSLHCSVQDAFDIEGKPIRFAKAFCPKCTFVLK